MFKVMFRMLGRPNEAPLRCIIKRGENKDTFDKKG